MRVIAAFAIVSSLLFVAASRTMLIDQKIVYLLEITLRNAKDMDIILAAIDVCACMSIMGKSMISQCVVIS